MYFRRRDSENQNSWSNDSFCGYQNSSYIHNIEENFPEMWMIHPKWLNDIVNENLRPTFSLTFFIRWFLFQIVRIYVKFHIYIFLINLLLLSNFSIAECISSWMSLNPSWEGNSPTFTKSLFICSDCCCRELLLMVW